MHEIFVLSQHFARKDCTCASLTIGRSSFIRQKFGSWRRHGVILVIVNKLGEKTMWFPVSTPISWLK